MKKLVFDKEEVVHLDDVTAVNTILGFKGGNPAVTIYGDSGMWHYYGYHDKFLKGSDHEDIKHIIDHLIRIGITEFYVI